MPAHHLLVTCSPVEFLIERREAPEGRRVPRMAQISQRRVTTRAPGIEDYAGWVEGHRRAGRVLLIQESAGDQEDVG